MGQGVSTVLAQVVAMELGADWRRVAVEPAPASPAYANVPLAANFLVDPVRDALRLWLDCDVSRLDPDACRRMVG